MAEIGSISNDAIKGYLNHLSTYPNGDEIQYRTSFENFFNSVAGKDITIIQEDRHSGIDVEGMPDFFVYKDDNTLFKTLAGFIECKKPAYKLEKLIESEQIEKYGKTCENIIITNYHHFILLQKGKKTEHDFELASDQISIQKLENLLKDFYGYKYSYIKTKKTLVMELAKQSFYYSFALREFMDNEENKTDSFYKTFYALFGEYQKSINYSYELADFCDIYSQTLVYGLLLARIDTSKDLNEKELNYLQGIPNEYKLLYEFLSKAYEIRNFPTSIRIALANIGKNINFIDISEIKKEFAKTNNGKHNIAVYLYEDFMKEYDKKRQTKKRKENGVYYTPSEVANFITRTVNEIIKTKFSLPQGYLSDNVKILDFACGTGTFLYSIFQLILQNTGDDLKKEIIKNKILEDIYGFELLFTPHIIAYTFLMKLLKENGLEINGECLKIYLTNTLDIDAQRLISEYMPELKKEYEKSTDIKNKEQILAIVGNPPYRNGKSQAKKGKIDSELNKYKEELNEKKINLDDLYIKFIRFAELKIEQNGHGIIGIITNNSYLDGVTHRQMRKHLYNTFDEIYIVNLHGNTRKGDKDKNIFDIMVGVSIVFFVKLKESAKKYVRYFSTLDNSITSRREKISFLENTNFEKIKWKKLNPVKPYFWFVDKDLSLQNEYHKFWKIRDIFKICGSGIKNDRDPLVVNYDKKILEKNMQIAFSGDYTEEFKEKYNITNSSSYDFADKLQKQNFDKNSIMQIVYRPFDTRNIYYKIGFTSRPSEEIMRHFEKENIGLCFTRDLQGQNWHNVFISEKAIDLCIVNHNTYCAPLYLYLQFGNDENQNIIIKKDPNFTDRFKSHLQTLNFQPSPEKILAYIYAVLHSPIYRKKYIEFLKTDFPAVPFTNDKATFERCAEYGQKLIDLHLLKNIPDDNEIKVSGDLKNSFTIKNIEHINDTLFLHATENKRILFEGITKDIYNFEIGSYKPIDKWLKYRIKDKVLLGIQDIKHLKEVAIAIKETQKVMEEIDELWAFSN